MSTSADTIEQLATQEYKYGFTTDVENVSAIFDEFFGVMEGGIFIKKFPAI